MQYEIKGKPFPVAELHLEAGESINCQNGAMVWMTNNMEMTTQSGGIGKVFGKMLTGESVFSNTYTAKGGPGMLTLGTNTPGDILKVDINPGTDLIAQKSAYLASTAGIDLSVHTNKKFSSGLAGGEGFIMQKISGQGEVFIEINGSAVEYQLAAGEELIVDTGYLAMMESTCSMDIRKVGGIKNSLLGGEGLFNTVITGPGKVWLQTNRPIVTTAS